MPTSNFGPSSALEVFALLVLSADVAVAPVLSMLAPVDSALDVGPVALSDPSVVSVVSLPSPPVALPQPIASKPPIHTRNR
jgi:hypothetical protein